MPEHLLNVAQAAERPAPANASSAASSPTPTLMRLRKVGAMSADVATLSGERSGPSPAAVRTHGTCLATSR